MLTGVIEDTCFRQVEFAGVRCGIMDQYISARGQAGHALLIDCRTLGAEQVRLPDDCTVLIVHSRVRRGLVDSEYNLRRQQCEAAARHYGVAALRDLDLERLERDRAGLDALSWRRARHVVSENQRTLAAVRALEKHDLAGLGELMAASHASMRDDFEISVPELDLAVETAVAAGAIGARMTGGGFGGAAIALVKVDDLSRVQVAVDNAFGEHAFGQPDTFVVTASDGAARN